MEIIAGDISYKAIDGCIFGDEEGCIEYEKQLRRWHKKVEEKIGKFKNSELTVGNGVTTVTALPCEVPWLSPFGVCLINITNVRRNENGIIEFQLGDENAIPYKTKEGEAWVEADAFYPEWPE